MLSTRLQILIHHLLPQHGLSRLIGALANCRRPWVKNAFIRWFIRRYHVDMSIALTPNIESYENFNQFFTRSLTPGARPVVCGLNTIACPVDGFVSQIGNIQDLQLFQAKGFHFDLSSLLAGNKQHADYFRFGHYATLYLSPKDYHRIHMPITGKLREMIYVPGKLFSVNASSVAYVPNLFARNERVICLFETQAGIVAVILVGAMIVAGIHTVWAGQVAPSSQKQIQSWQYTDQNIVLQKGAELGHFQLGSTVILLCASNQIQWAENIKPDQSIVMGQEFGKVLTHIHSQPSGRNTFT